MQVVSGCAPQERLPRVTTCDLLSCALAANQPAPPTANTAHTSPPPPLPRTARSSSSIDRQQQQQMAEWVFV